MGKKMSNVPQLLRFEIKGDWVAPNDIIIPNAARCRNCFPEQILPLVGFETVVRETRLLYYSKRSMTGNPRTPISIITEPHKIEHRCPTVCITRTAGFPAEHLDAMADKTAARDAEHSAPHPPPAPHDFRGVGRFLSLNIIFSNCYYSAM